MRHVPRRISLSFHAEPCFGVIITDRVVVRKAPLAFGNTFISYSSIIYNPRESRETRLNAHIFTEALAITDTDTSESEECVLCHKAKVKPAFLNWENLDFSGNLC